MRSQRALHVAQFLLYIRSATCVADPLQTIRINGLGLFQDSFGRARFFHGVNVVFKQSPWLPSTGEFDAQYSLNGLDADLLREWGFNFVRLGVMWPGVEPMPGQYDNSYLHALKNLTDMLAARGVYTLLDMHQDLLSRHYCGEGIPEHYVDSLLADPSSKLSKTKAFPFPQQLWKPMALNQTGYPSLQDCLSTSNFANYYVTEKVGALFATLYDPSSNLHQGFLKYWGHVAAHFAGSGPQVLGYELLNEPSTLCLNGWTSCAPLASLGNDYENKFLAPLYRAAAEQIRRFDRRPIFYESTIYPKTTDKIFDPIPIGNDTQQVYAYHVYCNPGHGFLSNTSCHALQDLYLGRVAGFLRRNPGLGGFMTEFGAIGEDIEDMSKVEHLLDLADQHLQSWAYWSLKDFHDFTTMDKAGPLYDASGRLETNKLRMLTRTYAPAISGIPLKFSFNPASAEFRLEFRSAACNGAPTEVYLNEEINYPHGFKVSIKPHGCLKMEHPGRNRLLFHLNASCEGELLEVHIVSKSAVQMAEVVV